MSPQMASLVGLIVTVALLISLRSSLRKPNCLGVFLLTQTVFVTAGVLLLPWVMPYLGRTYQVGETSNIDMFAWVYLEAIQGEDLIKTILLTVGGTVLVTASYRLAQLVQGGSAPEPLAAPLAQQVSTPTRADRDPPFSPYRLRVLSMLSMMVVIGLLLAKRGTIVAGLHQGLVLGQHQAVLEARDAVGQGGYVLWLMCCNILPFFAAAEWLAYRSKNSRFAWYPYLIVAVASLGLILLFQKRPLIIFLATLSALEFFARNRRSNSSTTLLSLLKNRRTWKLTGRMAGLLTILMMLYWATTRIGREGASFLEASMVLLAVSVTRILGRLSLPAAMYAHYFPNIEPHYGIHNIGLVTRVLGVETYLDTPIVFSYFSNAVQDGSVATCAIMDFYGGFGWTGWLVGCLLLGVLIHWLDAALEAKRENEALILGKMFCFVFVYYLSQASLPRSLWGYGGLFYLICWYCLTGFSARRPNSVSRHPADRPRQGYPLARTLD